VIHGELDPVRAQVVRVLDGERRRNGRALDPDLAAGAQRELERDLPLRLARGDQLVLAELRVREDVELCVLPHAWDLERVNRDRTPPVALEVEEWIRNRERHLVPQLRRADRVAVDQDVLHWRRMLRLPPCAIRESVFESLSSFYRRSRATRARASFKAAASRSAWREPRSQMRVRPAGVTTIVADGIHGGAIMPART
jgi:hypothetical protein